MMPPSPGPVIEEYQKLIPVAQKLYEHTSLLAQEFLLPLFLLSIAMAYSRDLGIAGAVVVRLKRLVLTALLLVMFPSISSVVQNIGLQVALSIDNLGGIDSVLAAAGSKVTEHAIHDNLRLGFLNDILVAGLVTISYLALYLARYLLLAFQHFYWLLIVVLAPLIILANLFESTGGIVTNLFRQMVEISCWPIVWAVLSAFLKALPFASAYSDAAEAGYNTIILMNFIIAMALLFSPFVTSQICQGAVTGAAGPAKQMGTKLLSKMAPKAAPALMATKRFFSGKPDNPTKTKFISKGYKK